MENHERVELLERTVGAVRPGRYSGGVFRVAATMRRVHRAARRTLSCQASASRRWTQTIRGGEYCATRGCKVAIGATFFVHIGGEYASGEYVSSNDLLSGEKSTPRSRIVY